MKRILCYGDSNTWGYIGGSGNRYGADIRWTGRLAAAMPECVIIEEGLNGRTTVFDDPLTPGANGMTYLEPCLKSHTPLDLVILSIGSNDLKVNVCGTASGAAMGVGMLADKTRQILGGRVPILIISPILIAPEIKEQPLWIFSPDCYEQSCQFPYFFGEAAKQHGCWLLDAQTVAKPCREDSLHMDAESHAALAVAVEKEIQKIIF